jgi:hypothetical protein
VEPRRWDAALPATSASPGGSAASPSLRDIQAQQADDASRRRAAASFPSLQPRSRGTVTVAGFALPCASLAAAPGSAGVQTGPDAGRDDRWYVPDAERPVAAPLRDILQAEAEEAAEEAAAVAAVAAAVAAEKAAGSSKRVGEPRRRASEGANNRALGNSAARPLPRPQQPRPT